MEKISRRATRQFIDINKKILNKLGSLIKEI